MVQKTLMGVTNLPGDKRQSRIKYYLLTENRIGQEDVHLYGIKLVKVSGQQEDVIEETEAAPAISYSEERVTSMLYTMIRNLVTPIHLIEIVDEMVTAELHTIHI